MKGGGGRRCRHGCLSGGSCASTSTSTSKACKHGDADDETTPLLPYGQHQQHNTVEVRQRGVPSVEDDDDGDDAGRDDGDGLTSVFPSEGLDINQTDEDQWLVEGQTQAQRQRRRPRASVASIEAAATAGAAAKWPLAAFFSLGSASDISWNAIYMSVAYFETIEGKAVISRLGLAQNIPWLLTMIVMVCWPQATDSARGALYTIFVTHVYMLALCILFPVLVFKGVQVSSVVLYVLVAVNGVTTGLSQSFVAACSALFSRYPSCRGTTSYQLMGAAFGISTPTMIQLFLIPRMLKAKSSTQSYNITLFSIEVVFPCAAAMLVLSLAALLYVVRHAIFRAAEEEGITNCCATCETAAQRAVQQQPPPRLTARRLWPVIVTVGAEVIISAVMSFACATSPHLTPIDDTAFWSRNLDTVALISFSISSFIGRAIPEQTSGVKWLNRMFRAPATLVLLVLSQIVFLAGVVAYVQCQRTCFYFITSWDKNNAIIVTWYALGAVLSGAGIVALSRYAQESCRKSHVLACSTVGQLIWLGLQVGSVIGIAVSLLNGS